MRVDVVGDLDELVPSLDVPSAVPAKRPSNKVLLQESVAALATVLDEYATQRQETLHAKRRLENLERDMRERPVRLALLAMTARWPWAMAARRGWWRAANLGRTVHRGGRRVRRGLSRGSA